MNGFSDKTLATDAPCPPLAKDQLRCYNMRYCPFGHRAVLALSAKGLPVEIVNVNTKNKQPWFLEKNPLGKVPVLERNGEIVYESVVCAEYLDDIFPEKPILPKDPLKKAQEKMLLERVSGQLNSAMFGVLMKPSDEAALKKMDDAFKAVQELLISDFFSGTSPGFVDYMEWPFFERLLGLGIVTEGKLEITKDKYPKLAAYVEKMGNRSEVKAVARDPKHHLAFLKSFGAGNPNFDIDLA